MYIEKNPKRYSIEKIKEALTKRNITFDNNQDRNSLANLLQVHLNKETTEG